MFDLNYSLNGSESFQSGLDRSVSLRRQITYQAMRVFSGWGYSEMQIPLIDQFDIYERSVKEEVDDAIRFVARDGKVMMLLSDVTPAIARLVSFKLGKKNLPLRTSYANKVFRTAKNTKNSIESYHLGLELIGVSGLFGELEVFLVALEVLEKLGVDDFQFNVSDYGIVHYLLNATGAPKRIREEVLEAIIARDAAEVNFILNRLGIREHFIAAVSALANLEGGLHQLNQIQAALPNDKQLAERLEAMRTLFRVLSELGYKKRIRLDLAALDGVNYYTGIAFDIVSENLGRSIGRGGRYDALLGKFGNSQPAVGFSLIAGTISEILHPKFDEELVRDTGPKIEPISISSNDLIDGFSEALVRRSYNKSVSISEMT